jgi:D-xylose 1-dehydrogenase (NADP+, D-xylono-1,5-lactone-forming)
MMRWGILGTAEISAEFIRAVSRSRRSRVQAVASRDPDRAEAWARGHGIPLAFGSYEQLLRSGEVDLVYNPLPNALHASWTIRALEAGCPVLCEKPLTVNAEEARQVQAASRKTGLHVVEAFMYRYHPVYAKVLDLIDSGSIGALSTLSSRFTFLLDDRSANPASADLAGGALLDVGCYCVHLSRMIARCEPSRVCAFERRSTVDDILLGMIDFPNGILAQFETGIASAERHRAEIAGTTGTLVLERPWHPGVDRAEIRIQRWGRPDEVVAVEGGDPYLLEAEDFVAVCCGERRPRWTVQDAVNNMAVIDALVRSAAEGRAVAVEPRDLTINGRGGMRGASSAPPKKEPV